ncbi:MAG: prolipoprotein diacylglyceryl transferase [Treponema sp.]|nr:prolipoprotein diacylglyceryl transferase [Treponema sp.]
MPLAINYPSWIQPSIFPGIPILQNIRWYGLMYIVAFSIAFFILNKIRKEGALDNGEVKTSEDELFSFFAFGVLFLLLGARIFSTLVYDTSGIYWKKPWLIFWPFQNGQFTGLAGMSYHGGFIGGLLGMIIWCIRHKKPVLKWMDAMAVAIPLGYTFGRLGNFFNGELYGRITTMPWGMIFPHASRFSTSLPWVQEFASKAGIELSGALVNLPRHPSQLYEAFLEGVALWALLWFTRKHKPFDGFSCALYTIGYGVARFIIEYFRQPDEDLGYRIQAISDAPTYLNVSLFNLSTGQILCLLMIIGGFAFIGVGSYLKKRNKN